MPLGLRATFFLMQVPPDFYIPDIDEDEQNPDERMNRECLQNLEQHFLFSSLITSYLSLCRLNLNSVTSGHTQDKQIQRDDEHYEGDNDNDHDMDDA